MKKSTQTRIKLFGGKASQNAKKILALLLGVVMLFGLLPGLLGAHDLDEGKVEHYSGKDNVPTKFQYSVGPQTFEKFDDPEKDDEEKWSNIEVEDYIPIKSAIEQLTYLDRPTYKGERVVYRYADLAADCIDINTGETIILDARTFTFVATWSAMGQYGDLAGFLHLLNNGGGHGTTLYTWTAVEDDIIATAINPGAYAGTGPASPGTVAGSGGLTTAATRVEDGLDPVIEDDDGVVFTVGDVSFQFNTDFDGDGVLVDAYFSKVGDTGGVSNRRFGIIENANKVGTVAGLTEWNATYGRVNPNDLAYFAPTTDGVSNVPGIMGNPAKVADLKDIDLWTLPFQEIGSGYVYEVDELTGEDKIDLVTGKKVVDVPRTFDAAVSWVLQDAFLKALNWYSIADAMDEYSEKLKDADDEWLKRFETGEYFQWVWGTDGSLVGTAMTKKDSKLVHEPTNGDRLSSSRAFGPGNPEWVDNGKGTSPKIKEKGLIDWSGKNAVTFDGPNHTNYKKGTPAEVAWIKLNFRDWGADTGTLPLKDLYGSKIRIAEPDNNNKTAKIFTLVEEVESHIIAQGKDVAQYWIDISECVTARDIAETVKKGIWAAVDNNGVPGLAGSVKNKLPEWTAGDPTFYDKAHPDYGKLWFYNTVAGLTPNEEMPKITFPYQQEIDGRVEKTDPVAGTFATFKFDPDIYVGRAIDSMLGDEDGDPLTPALDDDITFVIDVGYDKKIELDYEWVSGSVATKDLVGVFKWEGKYRFSSSNGPGWWAHEKTLRDAFLRCLNEVSKELRYEAEVILNEGSKNEEIIAAYYKPYWIFSYDYNMVLTATYSVPCELNNELNEDIYKGIDKYTLTADATFGNMEVIVNTNLEGAWDWGKDTKATIARPLDGPVTVDGKVDGTDGETGKIVLEFWELAKDVVGSKMEVDGLEIWFVKEGTKTTDLPDGQLAIMVPNKVVVEKNDANVAWSVKELLDRWNNAWDEEAGKLDEDAFNLIVGGGDYTEGYLASVSKLAEALRDIITVQATNTQVELLTTAWPSYVATDLPYLPTIKLEGEAFILPGDPPPDPVGLTVSGTITDENGDPLEGVKVWLTEWDDEAEEHVPVLGMSVTTSAAGEYLLEGIDEGWYDINAEYEGLHPRTFWWWYIEEDTELNFDLLPSDNNARLGGLYYSFDQWGTEGVDVPSFDPDVTSYTVKLPHTTPKTTQVWIGWWTQHYGAWVRYEPDPDGVALTSGSVTYVMTVRPSNGVEEDELVYTVKFEIEPEPAKDTPAPAPSGGGGGGGKAAPAAPAIAPSKNATEFVTALYKIALGRDPDKGGLENWTGLITSGKMSPAVAVKHFLLAEETVAKNLSHAQFVELLYNIFMGRKSDKGGLDNWVGLLVAGMSRESVINHFFASPEFTAIQAAWK